MLEFESEISNKECYEKSFVKSNCKSNAIHSRIRFIQNDIQLWFSVNLRETNVYSNDWCIKYVKSFQFCFVGWEGSQSNFSVLPPNLELLRFSIKVHCHSLQLYQASIHVNNSICWTWVSWVAEDFIKDFDFHYLSSWKM